MVLQDAYGSRFTYADLGEIRSRYRTPKAHQPSEPTAQLAAMKTPAPNLAASGERSFRRRLYALPGRPANRARAALVGQLGASSVATKEQRLSRAPMWWRDGARPSRRRRLGFRGSHQLLDPARRLAEDRPHGDPRRVAKAARARSTTAPDRLPRAPAPPRCCCSPARTCGADLSATPASRYQPVSKARFVPGGRTPRHSGNRIPHRARASALESIPSSLLQTQRLRGQDRPGRTDLGARSPGGASDAPPRPGSSELRMQGAVQPQQVVSHHAPWQGQRQPRTRSPAASTSTSIHLRRQAS